MIIDRQNQFSDAQALTADAISRVIDLGPLGGSVANTLRDIGAGKTLYLHVLVTTTLLASGGAAELTVTLESDSTADLATSATVHWTSTASIPKATLVAGYWIAKGVAIPAGAYEQFLGLRYNATTNDFTSGNITAWLSENRYDDRVYQSGVRTGVN